VSVLHYYFGWSEGAVWSNLVASAICAAFVWWRLRARIIAHHAAVLVQAERHHAEHMAAVDLKTPGGLTAVMDEVRRAVTAAESAHGAVQALGVAVKPRPARRGATEMQKTGRSGKEAGT
jgi:hypothetical protein